MTRLKRTIVSRVHQGFSLQWDSVFRGGRNTLEGKKQASGQETTESTITLVMTDPMTTLL
jgi:hypothetical protein